MSAVLTEKLSPVYGDVLFRKSVQTVTRWTTVSTQCAELEKQVGQAKHRLSLQPQVQAILDNLQWRAHARGVGLYEQLLGGLIQDIMPQIDKKVFVKLFTEKNLPALSIQLGVDENRLEDLWDGTGGSVTNVVSAGLRLIALARSPLRHFIMMDEPDCWLETSRVPRFASVLSQMASEIGLQMVLITHHPMECFTDIPDRVHLSVDSMGYVNASNNSGLPSWVEGQRGIRSIRLEGLMNHSDTQINLAPGVTLLSGPNAVGKSAILTAMRAVSHGTGNDSMIRHGHDMARITYELEEGRTLVYERVRKGSPKVVYTLKDSSGTVVHQERGERGSVPDWLAQAIGIYKLDDLDIQLHHQKMPVFLLDQAPSKQASILSAGQESAHIQTLVRTYKEHLAQDKILVKQGEKILKVMTEGLEKLKGDVATLGGDVAMIEHASQSLRAAAEATRTSRDEEQQLSTYLVSLEKTNAVHELLKKTDPIVINKVPDWDSSIDESQSWLSRHYRAETTVKTFAPVQAMVLPEIPELLDTSLHVSVGRTWVNAIKKMKILFEVDGINLPHLPEFNDQVFLMEDWKIRCEKNEGEANESAVIESQQKDVVAKTVSEINELLSQAGNACPACHQYVTPDVWIKGHHESV